MKHTRKDGFVMLIKDMDDTHLINMCNLLKREAAKGVTVREGVGGFCADSMWYDEYEVYGDEALTHLGFDKYYSELQKRGLSL